MLWQYDPEAVLIYARHWLVVELEKQDTAMFRLISQHAQLHFFFLIFPLHNYCCITDCPHQILDVMVSSSAVLNKNIIINTVS